MLSQETLTKKHFMSFSLIPIDCDMKRSSRLLIVIFTMVLLSNFLAVVSANPFLPEGTIGLEPSPPVVTVQSPRANETFDKVSVIWFNFSVAEPITTWNYTGTSFFQQGVIAQTFGEMTLINYSLDGTTFDITGKQVYEENGVLYYSFLCGQLLEGGHTILVMAEGVGYYGVLEGDVYVGSSYSMSNLPSKTVSSTATINFVVGNDYTPLPTPAEQPQRTDRDMTAGAIFAVRSIFVFLGLLFYFIRRK